MRLRTSFPRLLLLLIIVWIYATAYLFYSHIISLDPISIYRKAYIENLEFGEVMRSKLASEFNMTRDTNMHVTGLEGINKQEVLKAAWPPKAVPGDVGYGGAGISINRSLLNEREQTIYDQGLSTYKVNQLASDKLPLRRDIILDMPECKNISYDTSSLPTAGVVIIFTDEIWSVLMRTVFSILDAGPFHLITEIILVDDASQKDQLGKSLDEYIRIFGGKVKIVRLPERKGLISARLAGFDHVTGEVAVFLDAHCEVHKGWLEPLLNRIKQDDTVVAIPNTDTLLWNTFQYKFTANKGHHRCGFQFNMKFNWSPIPAPDGIKRKTFTDPVETATHMGCCLATSRRNFQRLGGYDPGLEIWGCENTELSLKTWMCGGRMEVIPCSHIAHMFRPSFPYSWTSKPHIFQRNCLRVAEVWMDEYKVFYQDRIADLQNEIDIGDVSQRKALREKLQCRSFEWFVKEMHPDVYIPINTTAIGRIVNVREQSLCIKSISAYQPVVPDKCDPHQQEQYFYLTREKQIRQDDFCLSYKQSKDILVNEHCHKEKGQWEYTQDNTIKYVGADRCIALSFINNTKITMSQCNSSDTSQQWSWPRKSLVLH